MQMEISQRHLCFLSFATEYPIEMIFSVLESAQELEHIKFTKKSKAYDLANRATLMFQQSYIYNFPSDVFDSFYLTCRGICTPALNGKLSLVILATQKVTSKNYTITLTFKSLQIPYQTVIYIVYQN